MLGAEVPDLTVTPCTGCGAPLGAGEAVWDPWHPGDLRLAAAPYHRGCADAVLPPEAPPSGACCGRCGAALGGDELARAWGELRARFRTAVAAGPPPQVVWRLVERDPRRWEPEHLACLLAQVGPGRVEEDPPALPGFVPKS